MPVRIYALAKELKLDSKELVDLCTRIGIPNKGSALASLEDDEVSRIRKYLAGSQSSESGSGGANAPRAATTAPAIGAPFVRPTRYRPSLLPFERKSPRLRPRKLPLPCPLPLQLLLRQ